MASDLSALIARLREAREGSRELDCDIYEAIDSNFPKGAVTRIEIAPGQPIFATGGYTYAHAPHYTTDLTAAVALAERTFPGAWIRLDRSTSRATGQHWRCEFADNSEWTWAPTPALALCLAVLIAKEKAL